MRGANKMPLCTDLQQITPQWQHLGDLHCTRFSDLKKEVGNSQLYNKHANVSYLWLCAHYKMYQSGRLVFFSILSKESKIHIGSVSLVYFRFRFTTSGQFRENAVLLCIRLQSHNWWQTALQLIPLPNWCSKEKEMGWEMQVGAFLYVCIVIEKKSI